MVSNINMSNKKAGFLIIITISILMGLNQYRFSKLANIERPQWQPSELIKMPEQPFLETNDPRKGSYNIFTSPDGILELEYPAHWTITPLTGNEENGMELLFFAYNYTTIDLKGPSPFLAIMKAENINEMTEKIKKDISPNLSVIKEESCNENCIFKETEASTDAGDFLFQEKIFSHKTNYAVLIFGYKSDLIEKQETVERIFNSIQIKN